MKVGVLVVAYNAEHTLARVLDRIPNAASLQLAEVLVQDDHSSDDTIRVAREYLEAATELNLTVVRHDRNLGYGGNQKAGYHYALDHGWDIVVLLHGDGQYAPEVMPDLIAPIVKGDADAVFGSRMLTPGGARRGGMPLYKFVGNRILSTTQNALTGLRLSEWHSGYRAYRVSALADLPFSGNSDGFDFDTEIILQLADAGKRVVEVPIPTYYGDEICYVNGFRYAWDVVLHTAGHRLGRSGFGRGRLGHVDEPYAFKPSPNSSHGRIIEMLRGRDRLRILDVGCGPGWLADQLTVAGHVVTGIDSVEVEGVRDRMERFVLADLSAGLPDTIDDRYDLVIAADIIEHLDDARGMLADLGRRVCLGGSVIVSVPNFAHWYPRARVVTGRFDYDQRGILDATHLRFFTRRSFLRAAGEAGLDPVRDAHTGLPLDAIGPEAPPPAIALVGRLDRSLVTLWPTMFAYQFVYEFISRTAGERGDDATSH